MTDVFLNFFVWLDLILKLQQKDNSHCKWTVQCRSDYDSKKVQRTLIVWPGLVFFHMPELKLLSPKIHSIFCRSDWIRFCFCCFIGLCLSMRRGGCLFTYDFPCHGLWFISFRSLEHFLLNEFLAAQEASGCGGSWVFPAHCWEKAVVSALKRWNVFVWLNLVALV